MQDLQVKYRYPSVATGLNCLAPGLGFYYLGQRREAWMTLTLVLLPWFALLLFPWPLAKFEWFFILPLFSVMLWAATVVICWYQARRLSPMIKQAEPFWLHYGLFWLVFTGLALLWLGLVLLLKFDLVLHQVRDNSMAGTMDKFDWVVVDAGRRVPEDFQRGDIVLLIHPETDRELLLRVAALPGEHVMVHQGGLFVDGRWQAEYYVDELKNQQWIPEGVVETTVPDQQLFVLADNRDGSRDSRYWGGLPADRIIGKQIYRLGDDLSGNALWGSILVHLGRESAF